MEHFKLMLMEYLVYYNIIPSVDKDTQGFRSQMLRVSLNAEETVTVFPALFFYPKAGGRRLKH